MRYNKNKRMCSKFGFKMSSIIYAVFLSLLLEKPLYGYVLVEKLNEYGIDSSYVAYGVAYRILREMEAGGLIVSKWETFGNGPAKRVYKITDAGVDFLKEWIPLAKKNLSVISKIVSKISEMIKDENK